MLSTWVRHHLLSRTKESEHPVRKASSFYSIRIHLIACCNTGQRKTKVGLCTRLQQRKNRTRHGAILPMRNRQLCDQSWRTRKHSFYWRSQVMEELVLPSAHREKPWPRAATSNLSIQQERNGDIHVSDLWSCVTCTGNMVSVTRNFNFLRETLCQTSKNKAHTADI